jgi:hypothetical protein
MVREKLGGCRIAEGLMRSNVVVDLFPFSLGAPQGGQVEVAGIGLIEFFGMGPVRPFHRPIEFGGARRQQKQANALVLTRLLKGRGEFAAAIDFEWPGMGTGIRRVSVVRNWVAVTLVARP